MLNKYGVSGGNKTNVIIVATQLKEGSVDETELTLRNVNIFEGINYMYNQLTYQKPIVVGVDRENEQATYNSDFTTEHFILIVGYGCEDGKSFFRYFDPGSKEVSNGTNKNNKLYIENKFIKGNMPGENSKIYTIVQVRRNK